MGKFEEYLTAIDPLVLTKFGIAENSYLLRPFISYDLNEDIVKANFSPFGEGNISALICSEMSKSHTLYFVLYPRISYKFINNLQELQKKNERIIFSGRNIFNYLHLGDLYEKNSTGSLSDLHILCIKMKENWLKIDNAFSDENVEKTYTALSLMKGNNEEEINRVLKTVHNLVD